MLSHCYCLFLTIVLTAVGDDSLKRVTLLTPSIATEQKQCPLNSEELVSDTDQPLVHRQLELKNTEAEGRLMNYYYIISFKDGNYVSLTIPCLSHELYKPVGLEDAVEQIITCQDDGSVFVLIKKDGKFSIEKRITVNSVSSSAAIVTKDDVSTAIYVLTNGNSLTFFSLGLGGFESPFFTSLESCSKWDVSSHSDDTVDSDNKVSLSCPSSNKVFLASGNDGMVTQASNPIDNPSSLVHVRNQRIAVEITTYGVKIHSNNFVDSSPITTPSAIAHVEYSIVDNVVYLLLIALNDVYLIDCSDPLQSEYLQTIGTEVNPIEFNTSYIYNSPPFNLLIYTVPDQDVWAVKVVDFITQKQYPVVNQPWYPLFFDITTETQTTIIPTSTTSIDGRSSATSTMSTVTHESISSSGLVSSSSTLISSMSSRISSSVSPSVNPEIKPTNNDNTSLIASIIVSVILLVAIIVFAVVIGITCFRRGGKNIHSTSSSQQYIDALEETGTFVQETGQGSEQQA